MARTPYTHRLKSDAGFVITEFECEVETQVFVPYPGADPIVRVEAVYMDTSHMVDRRWMAAGVVDLLTQKDGFVRNLGILIAAEASDDSDVRQAALKDHGRWEGIGPGERWVQRRVA